MAYRSKSHIPLLFLCVLKFKKEKRTLIFLMDWGNGNEWLRLVIDYDLDLNIPKRLKFFGNLIYKLILENRLANVF